MLTLLAVLGVLVALFLAAALATRESEALAPVTRDAADVVLPEGPVRADDVRRVRFGLALRGYRMDEVDDVLERFAKELEYRDRRTAELEEAARTAPGSAEPTAPEVAPSVDLPATDEPVDTPDPSSAADASTAQPEGATAATPDPGPGAVPPAHDDPVPAPAQPVTAPRTTPVVRADGPSASETTGTFPVVTSPQVPASQIVFGAAPSAPPPVRDEPRQS